jgi:hypothetical protein
MTEMDSEGWRWTVMNNDCDDDGVDERSTFASSTTMVCKREERNFFSSTLCFF